MPLKDWSPGRISALCHAAVLHGYGRLLRNDCPGEAARFRYSFGDDYREQAAELIVSNMPKLVSADVRQIIRELSNLLVIRHLKAEIGSRRSRT